MEIFLRNWVGVEAKQFTINDFNDGVSVKKWQDLIQYD